MRLLLDTHVFIWWDSEPDKLSERALALCQDRENELLLSIVSLWEIQIKLQLGKIELKKRLSELIAVQQELNNLRLFSVNVHHVYELGGLPSLHRDPFDRMLVAQAKTEKLRIVTHDAIIKRYPVDVEW